MKISFDEILPPLAARSQNSSNFSILGGVLDQNVFFSTFDLENYCQGQIFPRSQYQKGVVGEN
jgi:hypothetical protein